MAVPMPRGMETIPRGMIKLTRGVCRGLPCCAARHTHPKGRLLHSKFLSALFKKSEVPHFWFLQFGSL